MANFETENATFDGNLRKLEPTDPAHADTFNAGLEQLIKNDVALKKEQEASKISIAYDAENKVVRFFRGGVTLLELPASAVEEGLIKLLVDKTLSIDGAIADAGAVNKIITCITPEMYGAVGDGENDDTVAIKTAIAAKKIIDLRQTSYVITDTLELHSIMRNGTIIYMGDIDQPAISLKDGGGLVNMNIVIGVEDYASSVVLADYTVYDVQWNPMKFTLDGLFIDNTISTDFVEGSSCIKIAYDKYKVIGGQNINNVVFSGYMDFGIYIEPILRNENDNPVFNTAVFSDIKFQCCNTALKVYPQMLSGDVENAQGGVGLMLLRFSNENDDKIKKPFLDLHNSVITGDTIIPWDYYGENIPEQGTYKMHNSKINVNTAYFMRGNHTDDVRYSWFYDTGTGEYYSNQNVIKPENIGDRLPFRRDGLTPWSVDTIKAVRFQPDGYSYECLGFELTYNNHTDPTGKRTVQFGFDIVGKMIWRGYDSDNGTWSDIHSIYADGSKPVSYTGNRPDGIREGDFRYDLTYGKPIWWDGENWIFADGKTIGTAYSEQNTVTLIQENADLDDYQTSGNYGVRATATAESIANNPLGAKGFLLEVFDVGGLIMQRISSNADAASYKRRLISNGWTNWLET